MVQLLPLKSTSPSSSQLIKVLREGCVFIRPPIGSGVYVVEFRDDARLSRLSNMPRRGLRVEEIQFLGLDHSSIEQIKASGSARQSSFWHGLAVDRAGTCVIRRPQRHETGGYPSALVHVQPASVAPVYALYNSAAKSLIDRTNQVSPLEITIDDLFVDTQLLTKFESSGATSTDGALESEQLASEEPLPPVSNALRHLDELSKKYWRSRSERLDRSKATGIHTSVKMELHRDIRSCSWGENCRKAAANVIRPDLHEFRRRTDVFMMLVGAYTHFAQRGRVTTNNKEIAHYLAQRLPGAPAYILEAAGTFLRR